MLGHPRTRLPFPPRRRRAGSSMISMQCSQCHAAGLQVRTEDWTIHPCSMRSLLRSCFGTRTAQADSGFFTTSVKRAWQEDQLPCPLCGSAQHVRQGLCAPSRHIVLPVGMGLIQPIRTHRATAVAHVATDGTTLSIVSPCRSCATHSSVLSLGTDPANRGSPHRPNSAFAARCLVLVRRSSSQEGKFSLAGISDRARLNKCRPVLVIYTSADSMQSLAAFADEIPAVTPHGQTSDRPPNQRTQPKWQTQTT